MTVHWAHRDDYDQLPGFKCEPGRVYKTPKPRYAREIRRRELFPVRFDGGEPVVAEPEETLLVANPSHPPTRYCSCTDCVAARSA